MKRLLGVTLVIGLSVGAESVVAQDTGPYSFATYYKCDQNREAFADLIQEYVVGPILDGRVAAGQLVAWGWLSHRVGGDWRRVEYMIAPDRAMLLAARDAVIDIYQEDDEAQTAIRELTDICPDHDDYIWRTVATSDPDAVGQSDATAGMSTYFECDIGQEGRADELVNEVFAPIYNRHTGPGAFESWSWLAHDVGGEFRRLLVVNAADRETLYAHRDALLADIQSEAAEAGAEFSGICDSHEDYQWDIAISKP